MDNIIEDNKTNRFYVKIAYVNDQVRVEYWYNTDLRTDSMTKDIPILQIVEWLRG